MGTVTIAEAWPEHGEGFTIADLDRMPDDGHRYELLDGTLIVSPAPGLPHQRVAIVLAMLLEHACPEDLIVFPNVNVRLEEATALEPERGHRAPVRPRPGQAGRRAAAGGGDLVAGLGVAGLNLKQAAYERSGVPSYWVIDPDLDRPALRAFELSGGGYSEVAHVIGDQAFCAQRPFAVQIVPSSLVAKLRPA